MGYIKFETLKTEYPNVKLNQFPTQTGGKGVELIFTDGDTPKLSTKGFRYFNDEGIELGDYTDMKTVYRQDYDVNGYMLSNDGTVYVEPRVFTPEVKPMPEIEPYVPTPTEIRIAELNAIIAENKSLLVESDYKVIKNSEYAEAGLEVAYEPSEVNAERQAYRDAINVVDTELATLVESEVS